MYFKHPELLYALLLLVIPIVVHLFQLRKFRTTRFTNVKFLKKAVLQTRKSSRLKKFLVLCTRLLLLASLILAFAQPYFPPTSGEIKALETVIYLDNSYSMQARGKEGILFRRGVQDLLENLPPNENVSLFTNNEEFLDISGTALRKELQKLDLSAQELTWEEIRLKASNLLKRADAEKNFIAISDFQHRAKSVTPVAGDISTFLVQLQPESSENTAVDSIYVTSRSLDEIILEVQISGSGSIKSEVAIGLYDDSKLISRKTIELDEQNNSTASFSLPAQGIAKGRVEIEDNGLPFDNQMYFSINDTPPVQVVVIGDTEADFLSRIYTTPEFELSIFPENNVDFNILAQANLVILNEVERIPLSLINNLQQLQKEEVFLVIIPSPNLNLQDHNRLLRDLGLPVFSEKVTSERLITNIIFEHPLYQSVFNERVNNFEYPKVKISYPVQGKPGGILEFQNGEPFLYEQQQVFVFTAPLQSSNSNFKNAPLVVPTFYNIGNLAISPSKLYSLLGAAEQISIKANLQKDEILKLSSPETSYIPQQQSFQNKVSLFINDLPEKPGHYQVMQDSMILRSLSFNIDRSESAIVETIVNDQNELEVFSKIPEVFSNIKSAREVNTHWKWFVIFALFFLLTEMLILKFLK
ncbi:BatA domain-containing protein [Salinimicrobium oceani]|uniref:Aerotolerance regulator N-terminal domain-containing protein n=1 Tax=Salinimicrobium oceani TaxID=2722702 RepID=A0ABX1CYH3_9FLAO|nr:BatA domain-containing protein [Salinimicrobium oceani]NJW53314.1 hypothetical protein [Salinimicrobium oceani]